MSRHQRELSVFKARGSVTDLHELAHLFALHALLELALLLGIESTRSAVVTGCRSEDRYTRHSS
jgi:hypothetical protein